MSYSAEEARTAAGVGAVEMMDRLDDELVAALEEFAPHLETMIGHMGDWPASHRVLFLIGIVVEALEGTA